MEIGEKIGAESLPKEHTPVEPPLTEPAGDAPAAPHATTQTPPVGRRWVKGQSGNPRGRPSRAHQAAYVAHAMFDRKTMQLVDKVIGWGQGSDKSMLRLYVQRMVPSARRCRSGSTCRRSRIAAMSARR